MWRLLNAFLDYIDLNNDDNNIEIQYRLAAAKKERVHVTSEEGHNSVSKSPGPLFTPSHWLDSKQFAKKFFKSNKKRLKWPKGKQVDIKSNSYGW